MIFHRNHPPQLSGSDVEIERHKVNGEEQKLARIHVRAETSKVPLQRVGFTAGMLKGSLAEGRKTKGTAK